MKMRIIFIKFYNMNPIHIDQLSKTLKINGQIILFILLQLELKGIIEQLPYKIFSIK